MKTLVIIGFLGLTACGKSSSPDGRAQLRDEVLKTQIDSLKAQQLVILDSMASMQKQIKVLRLKNK